MEYLTSPAARIPYGGTNANTHTRGFTIVMARIISQHICVPAADIFPKNSTGFVSARTSRQLAIITNSAITHGEFSKLKHSVFNSRRNTDCKNFLNQCTFRRIFNRSLITIICLGCRSRTNTTAIQKIRETSVEYAAPTTPI